MSFDVVRAHESGARDDLKRGRRARAASAAAGVLLAIAEAGCPGSAGSAKDAGTSPPEAAACMKSEPYVPFDSGSPRAGQVDVLTQHGDVARTGQNLAETVLTTSNVTMGSFGKLFSVPVDGLIYAQPLIVTNYPIAGKTHDVALVATAHNSVYAFDANAAGPALWYTNLGPTVPSSVVAAGYGTRNIPIEVGILSTPVIDRASNLVYVTNKTYVSAVSHLWLHALDLATGCDVAGSPVEMLATVPGNPYGTGTTTSLDAEWHAQRPALLLFQGAVYIAFASHEDRQPYHGWVLAYRYDLTKKSLDQAAVLDLSLDGTEGGIWQSGQGLLTDGTSIYGVTSNGSLTAQNGGTSYGEAFVKMTPDLQVTDWFAPVGYAALNRSDIDLGSGGPLLIPGTTPPLMVGGGKQGLLYLVDTTNMGHLGNGTDQNLQEWVATKSIYGEPVLWTGGGSPRLYLWGVGDALKEFVFSKGVFDTTPVATSGTNVNLFVNGEDPVAILSVSSSGSAQGTGIVWANKPLGNPDHLIVPGTLYAFDAMTLTELWDSRQNAARDDYGNFAKFVPPTVANGKVYMASDGTKVTSQSDGGVVLSASGQSLVVYGLLASATGDGGGT